MRSFRGWWRERGAAGARSGGRGRFTASLVLLLAGVGLLAAAALQALSATRSREEVVRRVLTDYAASAHWNYNYQLSQLLSEVAEHLFHPVHVGSPDAVLPTAPPAESVIHRPHDSTVYCPLSDFDAVPYALRFFARSDDIDVGGSAPADLDIPAIRTAVREHLRSKPWLSRTEAFLGMRLPTGPVLVTYSRQLVPNDTVFYALVMDARAAEPVLRTALGLRPLLPPTLTRGRRPEELLTVVVGPEGGAAGPPLYRSTAIESADSAAGAAPSVAGAARTVYRAPLSLGASAGLEAAVALHPEAEDMLIIGGPSGPSLALLLGLITLAVGLVAIGMRQLRREAELTRMRTEFVSSVSHELRTPLALQRVFLDMIRLGRADGEAERRWSIDNIDRETLRLTHLVENILQFSRTEKGRMKVNRVPADVAVAVRSAAERFLPLAAPTGVEVELDLQPGVIAPIDVEALRQVVANLLENAVKYGPEQQTIRVGLALHGDRAVLTVDDQGPGIPVEERDRVWEPFQRGESARKAAAGGSGIGLSVVRDIVNLHDGAVEVLDAPTGGARFRVVLPGAISAETRAAHRVANG